MKKESVIIRIRLPCDILIIHNHHNSSFFDVCASVMTTFFLNDFDAKHDTTLVEEGEEKKEFQFLQIEKEVN